MLIRVGSVAGKNGTCRCTRSHPRRKNRPPTDRVLASLGRLSDGKILASV